MRPRSKNLRLLAVSLAAGFLWLGLPFASFVRDTRDAVELQCHGTSKEQRTRCEHEMAEALLAGELDPVVTLRRHCTRFANEWADRVDSAPGPCVERYGGWLGD